MNDLDFKIIKGQICPYCTCETKIVSGDQIYPDFANVSHRPKFLDKFFYVCIDNLDHYVGTYADNKTSLGRVANKELRNLKQQGHSIFDPLWIEKTYFKNQKEAYKWLSCKMNIPIEYTHFGMFTIEQCLKAINFCNEIKNDF